MGMGAKRKRSTLVLRDGSRNYSAVRIAVPGEIRPLAT
jgi:hypothetical protein